jgi:hypothetical protein
MNYAINYKLNRTIYIEDAFFLPQKELFIEIKNNFNDTKVKQILFLEEYPFELDVIFKKDLQLIGAI